MNPYDILPYSCYPQSRTYPGHLAGVAVLFGMHPPAVENCRVLEIGCADGTHLAAIALALPGASLLGLDYSRRQIEQGQEQWRELGVNNLELRHADLMNLDETELDEFDYIIVHGVYSWVAPPVQDRILALCRRHLAADGVAYVSYNTRPGWNMRESLRDMLMFHTRHFPDIEDKLKQVKSWLRHAHAKAGEFADSAYHRYLRRECAFFMELEEEYLYHEFLEESNNPLYFYEFIQSAISHGLRYVGDSTPFFMFREQFSRHMEQALGSLDMIHKEQYLDFLDNRQFRASLLTHGEVEADPRRGMNPEVIKEFYFVGSLHPVSQKPELFSDKTEHFEFSSLGVSYRNPLFKIALHDLYHAWPRALSFPELHRQVREALAREGMEPGPEAETDAALSRELLRLYLGGGVEAWLSPPPHAFQAGEYPTVGPLVRFMIQHHWKQLFNLRFERISEFDPLLREFALQLDGSRDRRTLREILANWIRQGKLTPPIDDQGRALKEPDEDFLELALNNILKNLADNALLVA